MIPQPSLPVNNGKVASLPMDGLGESPQPAKALGAFDVPKPAAPVKPTSGQSATAAPVPEAKPQTQHISLNTGTGEQSPASAPVPIPNNIPMKQPKTVVEAKPSQSKLPGQSAVITYVEDGDTAYGKYGDGSSVKCRIDSYDSPETAHPKANKPGQAFGEQAKDKLKEMVLNKEVTIRVSTPQDKYGRAVCQIEIEGKNIDTDMVRAGLGWVYEKYGSTELLAQQKESKANKAGMWAEPTIISPRDFRKSIENYGKQSRP